MKLAVSNIAWDRHDDSTVLDLLAKRGVRGIEVAPTKIWPDWAGATPAAAAAEAQRLADRGFAVPAFQAITFGVEGVSVFGEASERSRLLTHLSQVGELAAAMGAKVLVFGSPKLRDPGARNADDALKAAAGFFAAAAGAVGWHDVTLAIEANPPEYGCRFGTTLLACAELVRMVDDPHFSLHVDAGQLAMNEPDPAASLQACLPLASHFHASQPQLGRFAPPSDVHRDAAAALRRAAYDGWISIEMRRDPADGLGAIGEAIDAVRNIYSRA